MNASHKRQPEDQRTQSLNKTGGPQRRRKLSWRKKLLFAIVPVAAILILDEIVCRLLPHQDVLSSQGDYLEPDPDLIWRLKPFDDGPTKTNQLNLRDTSFKEDADVKILLLGDSVSWGDQTPLEETYPYLLEQLLDTSVPDRSIELINAAVPGYSTFQQAKYLELYGLRLKPDAVVLQFCLNDVVERYHSLATYGGDNVFLGVDTRNAAKGVYGFLLRNSAAFETFARYLQTRSRQRQEYDVIKMAREQLSPELEEAWELTLSEIDDIHHMTQRHDLPFLLVIVPYAFQLVAPGELRQPQDRLIQWAVSNNTPYVDLLPGLIQQASQMQIPRAATFQDSNHFSVFGHRSAAGLLVHPMLDILDVN